ncbi:ABC transporter ATP-binding protein [Pelagibacterium lacus]|uniref:ABC transporter ATP-binding protein n=1 Tax=Pelagibacterium lacus TaxID=2282655 RepID=A0A369W6X5_9HYPH|nr:ABC transporter ATP-binding protein [Pelagibacterium lacus]RDE10444.1 ABC transporter ATP-binding protein [Pelagibacterium lacus]
MFRWFEKLLNPYPADPPAEPPKGILAFCLHYMDGVKLPLAIMAVLSTLVALAEILLFGFLGNVIDWLSQADKSTFLADEGPMLLWMGLFVIVVLPSLVFLSNLIIHQTLLGNFPQRIRWMAHRYLIRQSMSYFQDEFAGRIATKVMQTALAVRETVMKLLDVLNYVIVYFVGAVVLAAMNNIWLALPFVVWVIAYIVILRHYVPKVGKISELQADARSLMTGRIVDSYTNIATVKLFSHSSREEGYAREVMDEFLHTVYGQMRYITILNQAITILNSLLLFSVGAVGIWLWLGDMVSAGAVAAAAAIVLRFQGMSQWIMWEMSALFENIGTVRDGINSLSLPSIVADEPDAPRLDRVEGDIAFKDVAFNYGKKGDDSTNRVIEGLNLHIRPGEKIGLVGRSGAGKSTIVNLLLRFYDRQSGQILVDGTDVAAVAQDSLRANVGVVTQDTSLLHRSVRENIKYGRPDATDAEMVAAAKKAEAHEFILGLVDARGRTGYDAHVGERGVKLSGGQRQRIAIARVLLKDAPILVLDEATSALDSEVEAAIQSQLDSLMDGKTVIAIAHRLSTIAAMDRLIVLDEGRVVEEGPHAQLVESGGIYSRLWARQSGGFIDADADEVAAQ